MSRAASRLSVVVVFHDMARELPRTLRSLDPSHQIGIGRDDYEVIAVDNGSREPLDGAVLDRFTGHIRLERLDPAPPAPARAANVGVALARHEVVGLLLDGARMASPGLLAGAQRAAALADRPIVTAPAFHLGAVAHMQAGEVGHDQASEDELLATSGWETDGYNLFSISTLAASSSRGLFGPMGESSSLFLRRGTWEELGGVDERFAMPGGGLGNHDLYHRACSLPGHELIVLLGEATFHQFHGGAATSRRYTWGDMHADYQAIRGATYRPPAVEATFVGRVPAQALGYVEQSARAALDRSGRPR